MRISSTVAVLALAIAGVAITSTAPHTDADEPVEPGEFWFDPDPGHVLLSVEQASSHDFSIYRLFADERLLIEREDRRGNAAGSVTEVALTAEQTTALIALVVDGGLMEWQLNDVEQSIPRQVYFSSAGEYQMTLRVDLPHYQRPGQAKAPATVEISLQSPTSRPNAGAEVVALAEIMRELRRYQSETGR